METTIYNSEGKKAGTITLPESVFGVKWNASLIHQVVTSMQANARTPVASTKGRAEVRGGGIRPWQQKGTGRARHSSIRSPIWKGGGVTHGPHKETIFARDIPRNMRKKALAVALSKKFKDGEILFVKSFELESPKTSQALKSLLSLGKIEGFSKIGNKRKNLALIAFADPTDATVKSFRNIQCVDTRAVRELNPVNILKYTYLIIENPEAAIAIMENRLTKKAAPAASK